MSDIMIKQPAAHHDLTRDQLVAAALKNGEGVRCANGALSVTTGKRTGRSPKDRYIVLDDISRDSVDWGDINQPIEFEMFDKLWQKAEDRIATCEHYQAQLAVGADPEFYLPVKVITEYAWHCLFVKNLFIHREDYNPLKKPVWTLLSAPSVKLDPAHDGSHSDGIVIINLKEHKVLLCGMKYAGEMKKAMFSVLNFFLPEADILPMHCAANTGNNNDVALFFGLSGTGKTTLSADPERHLIGDDEHGWSDYGVFNFEGGCYAKCIDLSEEKEPFIWNAIREGAVIENVVLDDMTKEPKYDDASLTQNSRAAYPREFIPGCVDANRAGHPSCVIFLTCDLYGVLPPVACLNREQAAYYFLSGYTALVGGTEVGHAGEVKPTFSTCFGAPFFPRPAQVYADLLMRRLEQTGAKVYLVNTGWTGGSYGKGGTRFAIPTTRAIIRAILNGQIEQQPTTVLPGFNFTIPTTLPNVDDSLLDPRKVWSNREELDKCSKNLIGRFRENFAKFQVSKVIQGACPTTDF